MRFVILFVLFTANCFAQSYPSFDLYGGQDNNFYSAQGITLMQPLPRSFSIGLIGIPSQDCFCPSGLIEKTDKNYALRIYKSTTYNNLTFGLGLTQWSHLDQFTPSKYSSEFILNLRLDNDLDLRYSYYSSGNVETPKRGLSYFTISKSF